MVLNKRYKKNELGILKLSQNQKELKKDVEEKIKRGEYVFEKLKHCPLCQNKYFEILSNKDRYGFNLDTVICKKCGLIYTNPRFTQKTYIKFYNSEYRGIYCDSTVPKESFWESQKKQGKKIFTYLKKIKKIKNLMVAEIGVGAGGILQYFKEKGNNVIGVDFGEEYLRLGKSRGLTLVKGDIKKLIEKGVKADILIYSHVLEHILDINEEAKNIKKILKKDGLLYIEVPGVKSLEKSCNMDFLKLLQNAHVYYFTLQTLKNFLSLNGFSLLKGDEKIRAVFQLREEKTNKESYCSTIISYLKKKEEQRKKIFPNTHIFLARRKKDICLILIKLKIYKFIKDIYFKIK